MINASKSNLEYQFNIIIESVQNSINPIESVEDLSISEIDGLIEQLEGLKEIKVALATLTN